MSFKTHQAAFSQLDGLNELPGPLPGQSREGIGLQAVVNPNMPGTHMGMWEFGQVKASGQVGIPERHLGDQTAQLSP